MKQESMKTLTISLSPRQIERLQSAVETGNYASNSEVVREALRLWEQREEMRQLDINRLKQAYEDGMRSGEGKPINAADFLKSVRAR